MLASMVENPCCSGPARTAKVVLVVFLATCWLVPTVWTHQADQPLSWNELKHLIQQFQQKQVSEDRILYLIAEHKVGFRVDKSVRKALKRMGATRLIVKAVARHAQVSLQDRKAGADESPPRQAPVKPKQGQEAARGADDLYTLSVDVDLVNVNVVVTDANGRYLTYLTKENFRIYEDRVEQQITHFSPVDTPFAVGLLLDTSNSTINRLEQIQAEAVRFIDQIHADDDVLVISFDDDVHLDSDFTRSKRATERAIRGTRTGGSTQLYEAVYLALQQKLRPRRERKAMVLFTDGVDTASPTSTQGETIELAKEADTLIYPIFLDTRYDRGRMSRNPRPPSRRGGGTIGIPTGGGQVGLPAPGSRVGLSVPTRRPTSRRLPPPSRSPRFPTGVGLGRSDAEYDQGREYLQQLAEVTGGTLYVSEGLRNLGDAFQEIAAELSSQYSLAYSPTNKTRDGTFRRIKIETDIPNVIVRAKRGYYSRPR
jgi:VWFA-related protein